MSVMKAMVLQAPGEPLVCSTLPAPEPAQGQLVLQVEACAVCRTDLHIVDGELTQAKLPLVPGHQIVGTVITTGPGADARLVGRRLGVPWLGATCGSCRYCAAEQENLCENALFTGYTLDGGFAEQVVVHERFCFPISAHYSAAAAAPLLCAGLIGYRSLRKAGSGEYLGLYGFGAAAHLVAQIAIWQGWKVYAFTRPGDATAQEFARSLGAVWAGDSTASPPRPLDAAIIFAPVGSLVPQALAAVRKGGRVVCGGIHMSDIPSFPYSLLWGERRLESVANLTRQDGIDLFALAPQIPLQTRVTTFPLQRANEALSVLRDGHLEGAAVLIP